MEQTLTLENLVRRTIVRDDGRFLYFYNLPGEDQPVDAGGERAEASSNNAEAPGKESAPNV